jgi:Tfp pilus assembly protein PilF
MWVYGLLVAATAVLVVGFVFISTRGWGDSLGHSSLGSRNGDATPAGKLTITYPPDGAMFPPEMVAPTIRWEDTDRTTDRWSLSVEFASGLNARAASSEAIQCMVDVREWTPSDQQWAAILRHGVDEPARIAVRGVRQAEPERVVTADAVSIVTSSDPVGAPIFYREVSLPFRAAVSDPARHVRWRFGSISSKGPPPIVLERMPICGNCHSFTANGKTLSMDVDFANDKGSYAVSAIGEHMHLGRDNIITWSDFQKEDGKKTFGLLSQISPDGRYVMSTVKDVSVFLPIDDNLAFSQLFFPVQGILCFYDRQTETFHALHGADDPKYVQSNPVWSPDGQYIVFARSESYDAPEARVNELGLSNPDEVPQFVSGEETFQFDLYRIPFNDGQGGTAVPLAGASHNDKSNYFPKYSPDGKWIVFCQAESFMLLRPDSQLYIIPGEGGEARRLECNTSRMNSWHSWSPNGKWLVFSSKAYSIYTQLMLTHVGPDGRTTPPVVLSHFAAPDKAANIPEFVNTSADAIKRIEFDVEFFADVIHNDAGDSYAELGDYARAVEQFEKAIEANPRNVYAYRAWAMVLSVQNKPGEAEALLRRALAIAPDDPYVHWRLGQVLARQYKREEAEGSLREAIRHDPTLISPFRDLAVLLASQGKSTEARAVVDEAIRLKPKEPVLYCLLGDLLADSGDIAAASNAYDKAMQIAQQTGNKPLVEMLRARLRR